MIPLQRPWLGPEELAGVAGVFDSRWLGMGDVGTRFEHAVRERVGARHVVAVNTGTSALHLALEALPHDPGDEVVVPSLTFIATAQAIRMAGYTPVFCEVRESDLNIDVDDALSRVTDRTRAIMPVHYGGTVGDMDRLIAGARRVGVKVVEDAAHAFGSTYRGRAVGTLGDVTCLSFDPIKNITCGEGGAVATDDGELARRIATMRVLGIDRDAWSRRHAPVPWAYGVEGAGYRCHLPNLNAAIGLAQMERFEAFRDRKREVVRRYDAAFAGVEGLKLLERRVDETFPFFYVVRVSGGKRDAMIEHLKRGQVSSGVHYIPNHTQPLFARPGVSLPTTERLFGEVVTLPLFYGITDEQVDRVVAAVTGFFAVEPARVEGAAA